MKEYRSFPEMNAHFEAALTVNDESDGTLPWFLAGESPRDKILTEIKRGGSSLTESNSREFVFTYHKCSHEKYSPTNYRPINFIINIGTFGFFPIGEYSTCRATLTVLENKTTASEFTTELPIFDGFSLLYGTPFYGTSLVGNATSASWRLPARRLLQKYKDSQGKKDSPP